MPLQSVVDKLRDSITGIGSLANYRPMRPAPFAIEPKPEMPKSESATARPAAKQAMTVEQQYHQRANELRKQILARPLPEKEFWCRFDPQNLPGAPESCLVKVAQRFNEHGVTITMNLCNTIDLTESSEEVLFRGKPADTATARAQVLFGMGFVAGLLKQEQAVDA